VRAAINHVPTSASESPAAPNELEPNMKRHLRTAVTAAILAVAAALVFGSGLLTAGATPPPAPAQAEPGPAQAGPVTPLPDFKPSEELPADAAVAFPTDI
jgi:hypothetical protein